MPGCVSVCLWTFSNSNISATSGPIITKFYLNHHWGGGKAAFVLSQIGSELWCPCQRIAPIELQGEKACDHSSALIFDLIFFILSGNDDIYNISNEFKIRPYRTKDC